LNFEEALHDKKAETLLTVLQITKLWGYPKDLYTKQIFNGICGTQ